MSIIDLSPHQCRSPCEQRGEFCAAPVARPGLPYCGEHMDAAYLKSAPKRRRSRFIEMQQHEWLEAA